MSTPAQTLEVVWRLEAPRIIARLARLVGDLGTAEELTQDNPRAHGDARTSGCVCSTRSTIAVGSSTFITNSWLVHG